MASDSRSSMLVWIRTLESLVVGLFVFYLGRELAIWLTARNVHGFLAFLDNGVAAIAAGLLVFLYERRRQRTVDELRESEQRFRVVANAAPVLIWMSGIDRLRTYFNKHWLDFTGRSIESELGKGWTEGVHAEDVQTCLDTYRQSFDMRKTFKMEYRLRRHDGEYRWMFDIGVPRYRQDGSFAGYIGSCVDVTERKQAEAALADMSRKVIEAQEQERTRIGRELHDDINQRLAILAVELEQLGDDPATFSQNRARELRNETTEISNDVQALSHELHSSKLQYLGVVGGIRSWCREYGERQKMEIEFTSDVTGPLPFEIGLALFRVLQEALHNAAKHSGVKSVQVQLEEVSGDVHLTIRDSGKGFDVESALRGKGLGLTSMSERVRLMNGTVAVESRPMAGTTIHVRLRLGSKSSERLVS